MLKLKTLASLNGFQFFVDKYQRGYKWGVQQVLDLLTDIDNFESNGKNFYCLQPVVVKIKSSNSKTYELIDGQQRLTTIFIITSILDKAHYSIDYQTRTKSAEFLCNIHHRLNGKSVDINQEIPIIEHQLDQAWRAYATANREYDNIDNYHFFKAYAVIRNWQAQKSDQEYFLKKLLHHTKLIWYKVDDKNLSSEQVFMNINSGKIALTNAELIKALFMVENEYSNNNDAFRLKQNEIALEWDRIEYALQDDQFWYFIHENPEKYNLPTRIDLLFDLIQNKPANAKDELYSYRKYAAQKNRNWQEVKNRFQTFQEWFEDRELYHLIGFIIARKISDIKSLYHLQKNCSKSEFVKELKKQIKNKFHQKHEDQLLYTREQLHYENSYSNLMDVLLLFNIQTYQIGDASYRFPFDRFKKFKWSLEHIHAQNSKSLSKGEELKAWCDETLEMLKDNNNDITIPDELKKQILNLSSLAYKSELNKEDRDNLIKIQNQLVKLFGDFEEDNFEDEKHGIGNMALLDKNTNSSLSNGIFPVKRNQIIQIDKSGKTKLGSKEKEAFIPICTKNVFLKYYSKTVSQMNYWSAKDRADYTECIWSTLNEYLPQK